MLQLRTCKSGASHPSPKAWALLMPPQPQELRHILTFKSHQSLAILLSSAHKTWQSITQFSRTALHLFAILFCPSLSINTPHLAPWWKNRVATAEGKRKATCNQIFWRLSVSGSEAVCYTVLQQQSRVAIARVLHAFTVNSKPLLEDDAPQQRDWHFAGSVCTIALQEGQAMLSGSGWLLLTSF